jgi:hypothetical protein
MQQTLRRYTLYLRIKAKKRAAARFFVCIHTANLGLERLQNPQGKTMQRRPWGIF